MERRTFLKLVTVGANALIAAVVAVPALRFVLHPLRRGGRQRDFIRIAPLTALSADRPTRVVVIHDRRDAFTQYPPGPIGAVWLVRTPGDGSEPPVRCLQTMCPHLGCAIGYAAERDTFVCPCHASEFDRLGRRRFGPVARDMDALPCRVTPPDEAGRRWIEVQYQEFHTGTPDQRPLT